MNIQLKFTGIFPGYGGGAQTPYYGRLYQRYDTGVIQNFLSTGIEVFFFETKTKQFYTIPKNFANQNNVYLSEMKGFLMFDQGVDQVLFKDNPNNEYTFLSKQTGYLYNAAVITPDYFLLLTKFGAYYCPKQLLYKNATSTLAQDCTYQNTHLMLIKNSFPSINTNYQDEKLLVLHQNTNGVLLIYDYSKLPQQLNLVHGTLNITANYKYIGQRRFILMDYNYRIILLTIALDGTNSFKYTPPLAQYIFYLNFGFEILKNRIITVNSKQAVAIKFNSISNDQGLSAVDSLLQAIDQPQSNYQIQKAFGEETITGYDYIVKILYDPNLQLYLFIKNYSIRLRYTDSHVNRNLDLMFKIEQNSGKIIDSLYITSQQKLVLLTISEQLIVTIPDLKLVRRDKFNIITQVSTIYNDNQILVSCGYDWNKNFQYLQVDLASNTPTLSSVYLTIVDYFVGNSRLIIQNQTDFQLINFLLGTTTKVTPGFKMELANNFFEDAKSYFGVVQKATPQLILFYNMAQTAFTSPEFTATFPSATISSYLFDYYNSMFNLYTIQSDGIYIYSLDANNVFQKTGFNSNTAIKTFVQQSKLPGAKSFGKVILYESKSGVILLIDKITKVFYFVKTSLQIVTTPNPHGVTLLLNKIMNAELLVIQSFSQTFIYEFSDNQYRVYTMVQAGCQQLIYLDSQEVSCYQPLRNETNLIPIKTSSLRSQIESTTIQDVQYDSTNNNLITTYSPNQSTPNPKFKIVQYNVQFEIPLFFREQVGSTSIEYVFYDPQLQIVLFKVDQINLYSMKIGDANPVLLLNYKNTQITWHNVISDSTIILLNLQGQFFSINYSTNQVLFSDDLIARLTTPPAKITSFDRKGDIAYVFFYQMRLVKYSITKGFISLLNFSTNYIYLSILRKDNQLFLLSNSQIFLQNSDNLQVINSITFEPSTDVFSTIQVFTPQAKYVFCYPQALTKGYLIDIDTFEILSIKFRTVLISIDIDQKYQIMAALTVDNIITIQDFFDKITPTSFLLQEFQDDLPQQVGGQSSGSATTLKYIYELDCALVIKSNNIYIYSITKQMILNIIRKNPSTPIMNAWILNSNILLYTDKTGFYQQNLHSILEIQSRFNFPKYKLKETILYNDQSNGQYQQIEDIYTNQIKSFSRVDGSLSLQYQLRQNFNIQMIMNPFYIPIIYSSNSRIIAKQGFIYIISPQNQIIDSFQIQSMNAISSLSSSLFSNNILYLINSDNTIIQVDISKKSSSKLQYQLNQIQYVVEMQSYSYIFQHDNPSNKDSLLCLDKINFLFTDLSLTLNNYNLPIIKSYQYISDTQLIIQGFDFKIYSINFNGCAFDSVPSLLINEKIEQYFYNSILQQLFIQRNGRLNLDILQNNKVLSTQMTLPSYTKSKLKLSDDQSFYILFSNLFISVYYAADLKLKVSIYQTFSFSEISDVRMATPDFMVVVTNTDIFSYHLVQNSFFQTFSYRIEMPQIISYQIVETKTNSNSLLILNLVLYSQQGFIKLNIPVSQDMQSSIKPCFYKQSLDSSNLTNSPLISDRMNQLQFINSKSQNTQAVDTIIFEVGSMESLYKLSSIPSQIKNLVLESLNPKQQSKIIVDQYFSYINQVSLNIFLRNSILTFEESINEKTIDNYEIVISNKQMIYFQNVTLEGIRSDYYFTIKNNAYFAIENLNILNLVFLTPQVQKENIFFNFINTLEISIKTCNLKDLSITSPLTLFSINGASKITIQNLIIENLYCQDFSMFTINSSSNLSIGKIIVKNVNCQSFTLMKSTLLSTAVIQGITYSGLNLKISDHPTIFIQAVKDLILKQIQIISCSGFKMIDIQKYLEEYVIHSVLSVSIDDFTVDQYSDQKLATQLRQLEVTQSMSQLIQVTDCQSLLINNFKIYNLQLSQNQLFYFESSSIIFTNVLLDSVITNQQKVFSFIVQSNHIEFTKFIVNNNVNLQIYLQNAISLTLNEVKLIKNDLHNLQSSNGLLNLINIQSANINTSFFQSNTLKKPSKGVINFNNVISFTIKDSEFQKNKAMQSSGACIFIVSTLQNSLNLNQNNNSLIQNCIFSNNESVDEQGGAIYISEQDIQIINSTFELNSASIGGAIRISSLHILPRFFTDFLQGNLNGNIFTDNYANLYGNNIGYYAQKVVATLNGNKQLHQKGQQLKIVNFRSNTYIDSIQLTIIDYDGNTITFPKEQLILSNEAIQQEFLKYQFSIDQESVENLFISQSSIQLSQNKQYLFNVTLIMEPSSKSSLIIKSSGTIPTIRFINSVFTISQEYMQVQLNIESKQCERGDYLSKISTITYCQPCPKGQYSLDIPDISQKDKSIQSCQNCPSQATTCSGSSIGLKNGYWRESEFTDKIYECDQNSSSCLAEDPKSKYTCGEGYVGPLCQTCDSQGGVWDHKYVLNSQNICASCAPVFIQVIVLLAYLFLTAGYLATLVFQNIKCSNKKILRQYTENIIGVSLGAGVDLSRNSVVLIKILMNFIQIYMIMDGAGFQIPRHAYTFAVLGDPTINLASSIECLLNISDLKALIFTKIMLKIVSITVLFIICLIAIVISHKLDRSQSKRLQYQISYVYMAIKVIFIYGGFGIVTDAVKALSCIKIGSKSYRLIDRRLECSSNLTEDYDIYLFAVTIAFIISILIPLLLLYNIRKYTKKSQSLKIHVIKSYSFLFQEYKQNAAYWEFVKIMLKYFIIFVINFFEQDKVAKIILAVLFLLAYNAIIVKVKPYKNYSFNQIDVLSIFTCEITFLCSACILSTENLFIQNILFIATILVNCFFLLSLALLFIRGITCYIDDQNMSFSAKLFTKIIIKLQVFFKINLIRKRKQFKSLKLWIMLKRKILGFDGVEFLHKLQLISKEKRLQSKMQSQQMKPAAEIQQKSKINTPIELASSSQQFQYSRSQSIFSQEQLQNFKQKRESNFGLLQFKQQYNQTQYNTPQHHTINDDEVKNLFYEDKQRFRLDSLIKSNQTDTNEEFDQKSNKQQVLQTEDEQCQVLNSIEGESNMYQSRLRPKFTLTMNNNSSPVVSPFTKLI